LPQRVVPHARIFLFRSTRYAPRVAGRQEHQMLDLIMLVIGLGFFALSVGYTIACDRL
jgi:hypothetical protein